MHKCPEGSLKPLWNELAKDNTELDGRLECLTIYANGVCVRCGIRSPTHFQKTAAGLLSESEILELEVWLSAQPDAGDVIPGARGLRKLRCPAKGRGKRGGARVIYYHVHTQHLVLLILTYAKNEQEDLTSKQLKLLTTLIKAEFP